MANANKIFIDTEEEIVFTIEKVLLSQSNRAILVIPKHAALVSSAVSLKLLTKQMLQTDKLLVLVTEDEIGRKLADKASLVAVDKISNVTKEIWIRAKELKEVLLNEKLRLKNELVGDRKDEKIVAEDELEVDQSTTVKAVIEEEPEEEVANEPKRLEAKAVELGNIMVYAGGDITDDLSLMDEERKRLETEPDISGVALADNQVDQAVFKHQDKNLNYLKQQAENAKSNGSVSHNAPEPRNKAGLLGKDLTSMLQQKQTSQVKRTSRRQVNDNAFFGKVKRFVAQFYAAGGNKKLLQSFSVGIIIFFLISYLFFPFVSITLIFAENKVKVNEKVTASTKVDEIDTEQLIIPANLLSKTSSITKEGQATGKGESGDKAKGLIDISNLTDSPIQLKKGTSVTNINTDLQYVITRDVTVPPLINNGAVRDVPVEASSFGSNYNIVNVNSTYVISGYTTSQMTANSYYDITGGTTKEIIIVTQQDIDSIKGSAEDELKQQLVDSLKGLISQEDILLDGSQKFKQDELKTSVEVDKEADTFTVDLKLTISAITVLKSDLTTVAEEVVKNNETQAGGSINLSDPIIRDISINDDSSEVTFSLSSNAGVTADISEDDLIEKIAGVSLSEAHEYISSLEGISEYRIKYTPIYIPFFLQRVPTDSAKIEVEKIFENANQ